MIDIIIVNWNAGVLLSNAVNSIINSNFKDYFIYVVDNGSTDNSLDLLPKNNRIEIIANNYNLGFGAACNQAISRGNSKYVLLLNPDTLVFEDTLGKSIDFMEHHGEISVMGCKHLDENRNIRPSCSRFPNFITSLYDIVGLSKIFPNCFKPSTIMKDWDHNTSGYVDQVMGAFMFIRREIFENIGLFDERFFVYYEDMDLSKRIVGANGKIYYNSEISIYHEGCGTSKAVKDIRLFYSLRSKLLYYKKHFNNYEYRILFVLVFSVEFISRQLQAIIHFSLNSIKNIIYAYKKLFVYFIINPKSHNKK